MTAKTTTVLDDLPDGSLSKHQLRAYLVLHGHDDFLVEEFLKVIPEDNNIDRKTVLAALNDLPPSDVDHWDSQNIVTVLTRLGVDPQLQKTFIAAGLNGPKLLQLTEVELKRIYRIPPIKASHFARILSLMLERYEHHQQTKSRIEIMHPKEKKTKNNSDSDKNRNGGNKNGGDRKLRKKGNNNNNGNNSRNNLDDDDNIDDEEGEETVPVIPDDPALVQIAEMIASSSFLVNDADGSAREEVGNLWKALRGQYTGHVLVLAVRRALLLSFGLEEGSDTDDRLLPQQQSLELFHAYRRVGQLLREFNEFSSASIAIVGAMNLRQYFGISQDLPWFAVEDAAVSCADARRAQAEAESALQLVEVATTAEDARGAAAIAQAASQRASLAAQSAAQFAAEAQGGDNSDSEAAQYWSEDAQFCSESAAASAADAEALANEKMSEELRYIVQRSSRDAMEAGDECRAAEQAAKTALNRLPKEMMRLVDEVKRAAKMAQQAAARVSTAAEAVDTASHAMKVGVLEEDAMPAPEVLAANSAVRDAAKSADNAAQYAEEAQDYANSRADEITAQHLVAAPSLSVPEAPPPPPPSAAFEIFQHNNGANGAQRPGGVVKQNSILFEQALLGETGSFSASSSPRRIQPVRQNSIAFEAALLGVEAPDVAASPSNAFGGVAEEESSSGPGSPGGWSDILAGGMQPLSELHPYVPAVREEVPTPSSSP